MSFSEPQASSSLQVLGPNGQPARLSPVQRDQSLLGAYDSFNAISFRLPPFNPDALINSKGWQVLDDLLSLSAVRAPYNILREAALYKGWSWSPQVDGKDADKTAPEYTRAEEVAAALTYATGNIVDQAGNCQDFRHVLWELLAAVHNGFAVSEINWQSMADGPYKGKWGFSSIAAKPCKQIGFDLDLGTLAVRSITSYTPLNGYTFGLPVEKVLRYTFQPSNNLPYGNGLGRVAYKHGWSIDFLLKFWNIALEMFGSPFILGKAPPGKTLELARNVLAQIRQGAPPVLPTGVDAELIEIAGTGIAGFQAAVAYHTEQLALTYLGSTLTTGTSQGGGTNTNALGQVHQDTQDYGLGYVRTDLENVLTFQLARRFVRYNFGPEALRLTPRLSLGEWDAVDMQQMASAFGGLINNGVVHEAEPVVRSRMGLPPPDPQFAGMLAERQKTKDEGAKNKAAKNNSKPLTKPAPKENN